MESIKADSKSIEHLPIQRPVKDPVYSVRSLMLLEMEDDVKLSIPKKLSAGPLLCPPVVFDIDICASPSACTSRGKIEWKGKMHQKKTDYKKKEETLPSFTANSLCCWREWMNQGDGPSSRFLMSLSLSFIRFLLFFFRGKLRERESWRSLFVKLSRRKAAKKCMCRCNLLFCSPFEPLRLPSNSAKQFFFPLP